MSKMWMTVHSRKRQSWFTRQICGKIFLATTTLSRVQKTLKLFQSPWNGSVLHLALKMKSLVLGFRNLECFCQILNTYVPVEGSTLLLKAIYLTDCCFKSSGKCQIFFPVMAVEKVLVEFSGSKSNRTFCLQRKGEPSVVSPQTATCPLH